ncbi:MAG: M23 family metallopeptidase, partial [Vulcanimicrobiota bacterium]
KEASIHLKNKTLSPLTVKYWLQASENAVPDRKIPYSFLMKPGEEQIVLKVTPENPSQNWSYRGEFSWRIGDTGAVHDDSYSYQLPYPRETTYWVLQGYGGKVSHFDQFEYSIDWDMPENSPVHAAREGLVVYKNDSFDGCGFSEYYRNRNNILRVLHSDGTIGEYVHFRKDGIVVEPGQKIKAGDLLGYSGNVGYSDCYHLHFNVCIPVDGGRIRTIPVVFNTTQSPRTTLEAGQAYYSP